MVSRKTTPARIGHLCSAKGAKCYLMKEIVFLHIGPGGWSWWLVLVSSHYLPGCWSLVNGVVCNLLSGLVIVNVEVLPGVKIGIQV